MEYRYVKFFIDTLKMKLLTGVELISEFGLHSFEHFDLEDNQFNVNNQNQFDAGNILKNYELRTNGAFYQHNIETILRNVQELLEEYLPFMGKFKVFGIPNNENLLKKIVDDGVLRMNECEGKMKMSGESFEESAWNGFYYDVTNYQNNFQKNFYESLHCLAQLSQQTLTLIHAAQFLVSEFRNHHNEGFQKPNYFETVRNDFPKFEFDFRFCCSRAQVIFGLLQELHLEHENKKKKEQPTHVSAGIENNALAYSKTKLKVVEIGVAKAETSKKIFELLKEKNIEVEYYGIDPYEQQVEAISGNIWTTNKLSQLDKFTTHAKIQAMNTFKEMDQQSDFGSATLIQTTSFSGVKMFEDGFFDLVFLDSAHGPESAHELSIWEPKVRVGGIVMGHDYSADFPEFIFQILTTKHFLTHLL